MGLIKSFLKEAFPVEGTYDMEFEYDEKIKYPIQEHQMKKKFMDEPFIVNLGERGIFETTDIGNNFYQVLYFSEALEALETMELLKDKNGILGFAPDSERVLRQYLTVTFNKPRYAQIILHNVDLELTPVR